MPLDALALKAAIKAVYDGTADTTPADGNPDGKPTSASDAGTKLAKAYYDYAGAALFGVCVPTLTGRDAALGTTLGGSLTVPGLPATHAAAWGTGLTAFWTGVAVAGPGVAGATAPPTGAAALVAALTTLFANLANTPDTAAGGLATALDTCTKTVIATVAPPPGTTFPAA